MFHKTEVEFFCRAGVSRQKMLQKYICTSQLFDLLFTKNLLPSMVSL